MGDSPLKVAVCHRSQGRGKPALAADGVSRNMLKSSNRRWLVIMYCGSTNAPIKRFAAEHLLKHGDTITIAEIRLRLLKTVDVADQTSIIIPLLSV